MEINIEKKSNFKAVYKFIWNVLKDFPVSGIIVLIATILYAFSNALIQYATKDIIDTLELNSKPDFLKNIFNVSIIYIAILAITETANQIGIFCEKIKILPEIYKKIIDLGFNLILKQNYYYHQNNLSGNLGNKLHDLAIAVPAIIKLFISGFFYYFISISASSYALYDANIKYLMIIVCYFLLSVIIIYYIVIKNIFWSKKMAESQSYIVGKIINIFLNIFPIKLFSGIHKENQYLKAHLDQNLKITKIYYTYQVYFSVYAGVSVIILQQ